MLNPILALVLCGGASTRMGQNKALVKIQGSTYLQRLQSQLTRLDMEMVLSCQPHQFPTSFVQVHDHPDFAGAGPMSGLLSAMKSYPETDFLVLGSDQYLLDTESINRLKSAAENTPHNACLVLPEDEEIQPFPAVYKASCFNIIHQAYKDGQTSLRKILLQHPCIKVHATTDEALKNFNTPEDLISWGLQ